MKYTAEERLDIGRRIYDSELTRYEAAVQYGISDQTARNYMRMYRDANQLPPKGGKRAIKASSFQTAPAGMEAFETMTKRSEACLRA